MNIYAIASEDYKVFCVGQTTRTFEERHKDGDWAKFHNYVKARHEKIVPIGWWEDTKVLDTEIHKFLSTLPNIRKYAEWFSFNTTKDTEKNERKLKIIKNEIVEKFFTTIPEKKEYLELCKHQKEFVAKAQADYLEFLLFAKCRSGKSAMTLSHIVNRKFKTTLVVSRYKSPIQSWNEDIEKFSNFSNLIFIDLTENNDYIKEIDYWYNTDNQLVLWGCIQNDKTLDLPVDIDLIVYDEAHVGYDSKQWNELRKATKCPALFVTGTAFKMVWDFPDSCRYIYSYYEEQLDKKMGLNNRPTMKVILAKYDSSQYQKIFGDDPDAMKNMFNVDEKGNFIHPELVQDFVYKIFATQRDLRHQDRLLKDSTHLFITLPSKAACDAFEKYMKGTRFAPLVVHSDRNKDHEDINKHIAENPTGSCIITRTANVLGVTVKEIDTIINCAEGKSIEFWTQFAFRGGSSDRDWQVIDFCPQRCLETLRQTYVAACDTSPKVSEYDFTEFVSIIEWTEKFTPLTADQVNEIMAVDPGNVIRLISGLVTKLDSDKLRDLDFNLSLKPSGSNDVKSVQLNDNNANGKTNKTRRGEMIKSEKDEIYGKLDTIQSILERIPLVLFHAINSGELMNNIDSVINSAHYQPVTMDDEKILEKLLEFDVINREALSHRISIIYTNLKHSIKNNKLETLSKLSESTQSQQDIPLELLYEML